MKGKLLIEPGFEAGSEFCGNCNCCDLRERIGATNLTRWMQYFCYVFREYLKEDGNLVMRCQTCQDAEKPLLELNKIMHSRIENLNTVEGHDKMDHFPYECWTDCKICNPTGKRPQSVQ